MIHFRDIWPTDLTEEEQKLLVEMADHDYDGRKAVDLLAQVLANRCGLLRIEGEMTGLMLARKTKDRLGWTLWIEGIAGAGLFSNGDEFDKALSALAKERDCQSISGLMERTGTLRLTEKRGYPVVARIFRKVLERPN